MATVNLNEWTTNSTRNAVIRLIRVNPTLGEGSCSVVDGAMTDDELFSEFVEWLVERATKNGSMVVPTQFLRHMLVQERQRNEHQEDLSNG